MKYKHTQIGYLIIATWFAVLALFVWVYFTAASEPVSADSGPNLAITSIMTLVLIILASFVTLQTRIDDTYLHIKFGYGIFQKKFALSDIVSTKVVKNKWYYGWGIKLWLWPKMWIYSISGFDAVEIQLKNDKVYRIGTDDVEGLAEVVLKSQK